MERNWCWNGNGNGKNNINGMMDVTPFLLFESTADSEEVKAVVNEDATMDEGVVFRFDDDEEDDDDDAQSCSYDHSSYINKSSFSNNMSHNHDQTQGLIHDHHFDEDDDSDVDNDDDDDDDNWGESNMMDRCMQQQQNGSRNFCVVDSSNQREIDRNFWETCLAT